MTQINLGTLVIGILVACGGVALLAMRMERWSDDRRRAKDAKAERKRWDDGPTKRS